MRRFAVAATVLIAAAGASAAPVSAAESPPATEPVAACVQPVARLGLFALSGTDGAVRVVSANGPVIVANGATITLKSGPTVSKGVQISALDGRVTIVAERMNVRKIAGTQYAFLYDRPGEACALEQLPKELQLES